MADILVIYFSRTGSTETVARALAAKLGADLDVIHTVEDYAGGRGYLKAVLQSVRRFAPSFGSGKHPGAYRLVVIGSPVWVGGIAGPMRSYLAKHAGAIDRLAAFCVSGSGGKYERFFREVEQITGKAPAPQLALGQQSVLSGAYKAPLDRFAEALQAGRPDAVSEHPAAAPAVA